MKRIAINGFGRIGRLVARIILKNKELELVAINDLATAPTLAHLLKYDSIHGKYDAAISVEEDYICIDDKKIKVYAQKDPSLLPWKELDVDVVIESTGRFLDKESASMHIAAGAKKVLLSAPPKSNDILTVVLGVQEQYLYDKKIHLLSNASCTTNCVAPMLRVLETILQIDSAWISTVHAFTGDQSIVDAPHKDLRRARAASQSIIPTTTGASKAITALFPHLEGKLDAVGIRVPVPDGSLVDIIIHTSTLGITKEIINKTFQEAATTYLKGIIEYTEEPLVSIDIIGNAHSAILDSELTSVVGQQIKITGWYDNEYGYSNRIVDVLHKWD